MNRRLLLAATITASSFSLLTGVALALNQPTHAIVNEEATRRSALDVTLKHKLGLPEGQEQLFRGKTVIAWLREGGVREDDSVRFLNHFHNPLKTWASAGLEFFGQHQSSIRWMQRPFDCAGVTLTDPKEWSWSAGRCYLYHALTSSSPNSRETAWAHTFRAVGQAMHLIVDASVPEHTRNDPHPLGGFFGSYEYWVLDLHPDADRERDFIGRYLAAPKGPASTLVEEFTNDPVATIPIARLIDANVYTGADPNATLTSAIGIAEFANANFFSEDTGYRRFFAPNYPYPSVEQLRPSTRSLTGRQGVRAYYQKGSGDGLPVDPALAECALDAAYRDDGIPTPQYKCTDANVWEQTALAMLPRAVGYAAAAIDYFFRGHLSVIYEKQNLRISGATEHMAGEVMLLYDKADGSRVPLATWAAVSLDANDVSPPLSAPRLPSDAAPDAPCWLVFRGQFGLESGGVTGASVPCPPAAPPPPSSGQWYVYYCAIFDAEQNYYYATTNPPMLDFEPDWHFYHQLASGAAFSCSLRSQGASVLPPDTRFDHPS